MTREEQKQKKIQEELDFINSIKGKQIDGKIKSKYRTTSVWHNLRQKFYIKEIKTLKNGKEKIIPNIDVLTLRPLKKSYNLHHKSILSEDYTTLDETKFLPLNNGSHDVVHTIYSECCKDREYFTRLKNIIDEMGEMNNWNDF